MGLLPNTGMETATYGTDGWNAIYTANFEKIDTRLGPAMRADPTEDVEIEGSTSDDTKMALKVTNSTPDEIFSIRNDGLVNIPNTMNVGDTTDKVVVDNVNAVRLHGDTTVFEDLRIDGNMTRVGATPPSFAKFKNNGSGSTGVYLQWFSSSTINEVHFTVQLPHSWKEGSSIYPHVHWIPKTNADGSPANQKVRWGFEYTPITNIGDVFSNTSIIYAEDHHITEELVADKHYLTPFSAITMSGKTISCILVCRLFRDATHANDTYEDLAGLLYFDIHYEVDSLGSNEELSKD